MLSKASHELRMYPQALGSWTEGGRESNGSGRQAVQLIQHSCKRQGNSRTFTCAQPVSHPTDSFLKYDPSTFATGPEDCRREVKSHFETKGK